MAVFPATPILDNFNRADENPLAGGWRTGVLQGSVSFNLKLVSNQVLSTSPAAPGDKAWDTTFTADQESYTTVASVDVGANNAAFAFVRVANPGVVGSTSGYYAVFARSGLTRVYEFHSGGGAGSLLFSGGSGSTLLAGDVVGLRMVGTKMQAFWNGVVVLSGDDLTYSAGGYIGAGVAGSDYAALSNFGGGNVPFNELPVVSPGAVFTAAGGGLL
jgi:hypothetical protein